jgi:hypothetical protein
VRLGKSGCVQFQFTESLLVTAVWVVPDGNLPARKPGLALLRAKALAEPRILGLLRLQTPNPKPKRPFFSRKARLFTRTSRLHANLDRRNRIRCDL